MLIVVIGLFFRMRVLIRSVTVFIGPSFCYGSQPCRNDADDILCFQQQAHDKHQSSVSRHTNNSISLFSGRAGIFMLQEWIEKDLACLLETDSMLAKVGMRLFPIPDEGLAFVQEGSVHDPSVYTLYV